MIFLLLIMGSDNQRQPMLSAHHVIQLAMMPLNHPGSAPQRFFVANLIRRASPNGIAECCLVSGWSSHLTMTSNQSSCDKLWLLPKVIVVRPSYIHHNLRLSRVRVS